MSGFDRKPYLTATVLDQALLNSCQDNLECSLEMVADIQATEGIIRISERNKYLVEGGTGYFYEARTNIPVISRTIGDWLVPEIQFSTLQLEISNVDGRYNAFLPCGTNYSPWINKNVTVRLGLGEVGNTFFTIFSGRITDVGGFKRTVKSLTVIARDVFDTLTNDFPKSFIKDTDYAQAQESVIGKILPVIYGDWTVSLDPEPAIIPTFVVNGNDENVKGGDRNPVQVIVTDHDLTFFDANHVYLKKGDTYYQIPSSEITVGTGNKSFTVIQDPDGTWVNDEKYEYDQADAFYVRVKGKDLGAYDDNIIWQARDLLITYGGISESVLDANWETFRDKNSPAQSAISNFKSRIYENSPKAVIQYVLSLLEQVRLELFVSRDQKLKINSLHFEDFVVQDYTLKNWDIVLNSFNLSIDERHNFNRCRGVFDLHPDRAENAQSTAIFRNQAAITQIGNKEISKQITFPNLYETQTVNYQVQEILKIASSTLEIVQCSATWRSALKDIGDIVKMTIQIGSVEYVDVPVMIREIGYDPIGLKLPMRLWVFAMCPFPAYQPNFAGTVGGFNATITEEA
jgi:hypothetical protein